MIATVLPASNSAVRRSFPVPISPIDSFILEMRWRMKNRSRAIDEDRRIIERVKLKTDVDKQ